MSELSRHTILEFARAQKSGDPYAFRFEPQEYLLRSAGGAFASARFEWSPELMTDLAALRDPDADPAVRHRLGNTLRAFLEATGWKPIEQEINASMHSDGHYRLTFRSAAAELYALPWELLTLQPSGQALGALPNVLLQYEWPETKTAYRQGPAREPRVLLAWSAAGGAVPGDEHEQALRAACDAAGVGFDPARDLIPNATLSRIAAALQEAERGGVPVVALHVLCHGATRGSVYGLALDNPDGDGAVIVTPSALQAALIRFADSVPLVVLSACDSGNEGEPGNHVGSAAQMLHRGGFRAVLASRYPLSAAGSKGLTRALYDTLLAPRRTLAEAVLAIQNRMVLDANTLDWASLQLYARHDDAPYSLDDASTEAPTTPAAAPAPVATTTPLATPSPPTMRVGGMEYALSGGDAAKITEQVMGSTKSMVDRIFVGTAVTGLVIAIVFFVFVYVVAEGKGNENGTDVPETGLPPCSDPKVVASISEKLAYTGPPLVVFVTRQNAMIADEHNKGVPAGDIVAARRKLNRNRAHIQGLGVATACTVTVGE